MPWVATWDHWYRIPGWPLHCYMNVLVLSYLSCCGFWPVEPCCLSSFRRSGAPFYLTPSLSDGTLVFVHVVENACADLMIEYVAMDKYLYKQWSGLRFVCLIRVHFMTDTGLQWHRHMSLCSANAISFVSAVSVRVNVYLLGKKHGLCFWESSVRATWRVCF